MTDRSLREIAIAVVRRGDDVLVGRRPNDVPLGGLWEFPGGKVRCDESPVEAAVRECAEETGLEVRVLDALARVVHTYDHGTLQLDFFACQLQSQHAAPRGPFRWISIGDLSGLDFPEANREVLDRLMAEHEAEKGGQPEA
jgi:8-oxo-dGTP diphosphatase